MRLPHPRFLLCLSVLCATPAFSQSAPPSPASPAPIPDSRTHIPTLIQPATATRQFQQHLLNDLRNASVCYVIDTHQFARTAQNFNSTAVSANTSCQPATQYHMQRAVAVSTR